MHNMSPIGATAHLVDVTEISCRTGEMPKEEVSENPEARTAPSPDVSNKNSRTPALSST